MTLPLQQAGDPTSARKVRLPLYVAVPEPELLNQDFYAAEVEKLGTKPFASCPQAITRSRDTSANGYNGLKGCFSLSSTARGCPAREGERAISIGRGTHLLRRTRPIISFFVGCLVIFRLHMHFASRMAEKSHLHMLNMLELV